MVLVDTHILLWIFSDSGRLTEQAKRALNENDACVSIASLWEMAIKASLKREEKRLELEETIQDIAGRDMAGELQTVSQGWKGDNSRKFMQVGTQVAGEVNDTGKAVEKTASVIRQIAETTYNAEMKALSIIGLG